MSSPVLATNLLAGLLLFASCRAVAEEQTTDAEYERLIREERQRNSSETFTERLASGLAAIGIGLYGYYNDDRGLLTHVIYSTTQTAGILLVSDAIASINRPSLLLLTDRHLGRRGSMDMDKFRRGVVTIEHRRAKGEITQRAYTSAILATVYGYNGFRENTGYSGLRNVFYFLSFNFSVISAASFYQLFFGMPATATSSLPERIDIAWAPWPTLTYRF